MRILRAIKSCDRAGGGPIEGVIQSSQILLEWGHQVEIVCLDPPSSPWLKDFPIVTHALGAAKDSSYGYSSKYVPWLCQNAGNYDVAIVHGIWQYHSFGVWLALRQQGIPYFVFTHGMLDPWFKRTYPLKHLKKWLYWPWTEYQVLRDARAVLFTSEQEKILARKSFWLYKCNEIVVNYGTAAPTNNPVTQSQLFLDRFPHLRGKRLFLFLGRIHPKKGCDLSILAFAKVADADDSLHLVMAGPDRTGWQAQLQQQAQQLGIEQKITWTGMLTGDLKWGAFHTAEVLILPSHQENFGIAVVESLACGVPVLISNQVNIWREILADNAGLVANDDLEGTTQLLQKWIAMSPNEQKHLKQNAQKCFIERFEIHQAASSLINTLYTNGIKK